MSADEARAYHRDQVASLADAGADMVSAITMTYPEEAIGFASAAADAGVPAIVSFTVETDGRLPDGSTLGALLLQQSALAHPLCTARQRTLAIVF